MAAEISPNVRNLLSTFVDMQRPPCAVGAERSTPAALLDTGQAKFALTQRRHLNESLNAVGVPPLASVLVAGEDVQWWLWAGACPWARWVPTAGIALGVRPFKHINIFFSVAVRAALANKDTKAYYANITTLLAYCGPQICESAHGDRDEPYTIFHVLAADCTAERRLWALMPGTVATTYRSPDDPYELTPLYVAAEAGNVVGVTYLLGRVVSNRAIVEALFGLANSIVHFPDDDRAVIARLLFDNFAGDIATYVPADLTPGTMTPQRALEAALMGLHDLPFIRLFIERGITPTARAFCLAVNTQLAAPPDILALLCSTTVGATPAFSFPAEADDAHPFQTTAFMYAVGSDQISVVRELLDKCDLEEVRSGVIVDNDGDTPFHEATTEHMIDFLARYFGSAVTDKYESSTNTAGNTPLSAACAFGPAECVHAHLNYRANPNAVNDRGVSPLLMVCSDAYYTDSDPLHTMMDKAAILLLHGARYNPSGLSRAELGAVQTESMSEIASALFMPWLTDLQAVPHSRTIVRTPLEVLAELQISRSIAYESVFVAALRLGNIDPDEMSLASVERVADGRLRRYALAGWTPERHGMYPRRARQFVGRFMLAMAKQKCMPSELWLYVLGLVARLKRLRYCVGAP